MSALDRANLPEEGTARGPGEGAGRLDALHLGCGRLYRTGHVNVDAHDPTAADAIADALGLPFPPRTFGTVRADHLIEHLARGEAPYLLAECFRVLRPGGRLTLETPDPGASFHRFLSAEDAADREASLAWVLGRPSAGYGHRWLHDRESLERSLADAGFEGIRFEAPRTHRYAPGLRVSAIRADSPLHEIIADLRLRVPRHARADPEEAREIERRVFDPVRACAAPSGEAFLRRFRACAILGPELAARWARLAVERGVWPREPGLHRVRFPIDLARARLPALLDAAFAHLCARTNAVPDGHDFLFERADAVLAEHLATGRPVAAEALAEALELPAEERPPSPSPPEGASGPAASRGPTLFTRARLERIVTAWRDRGIRLLALGRLREAEALLRRAFNAKLRYFYTAWNLAVLRTIQGDPETAAAYYRVALRFENPGPEPALRRALALCLLRAGRRDEAREEIARLAAGPERRDLEEVLARLETGGRADAPPPTEAVPAGKGIWW